MIEPGTTIGDLSDEQEEQYSRELIAKASRRVAMLAFFDQKSGKTFGNGTGSLIRLRGGSFIVTNHHVWKAFLDIKKSEPNVSLMLIRHDSGGDKIDVGEVGVDISEARVVALDEELDLAVLEYCSAEIEEAGKEYYDLSSSPAIRATEGASGLFVGFPGSGENFEGERWTYSANLLQLRINSVSDTEFNLRAENTKKQVLDVNSSGFPGMSGSLVYCSRDDRQPASPCGILFFGPTNCSVVEKGDFVATHLDLIQSDGTINRGG